LFRDYEGGVVGQHDAAGANLDAVRASRNMGERHRGRGTRNAGQVVMLSHPKTPVTERLDMPRQVQRIAQRLTGIAAFNDWGKIENRKWNHRMTIAPGAVEGKSISLIEIAVAPDVGRAPGSSDPRDLIRGASQ
jgi:hypothetical protein